MIPTTDTMVAHYIDRFRRAQRKEIAARLLRVALVLGALFAVVAVAFALTGCTVDASHKIDGVCLYPDGAQETCNPSDPFVVNTDDGGASYAFCTVHPCQLGSTCIHGAANVGQCELIVEDADQ